jgi:hypothetical protein
MDRELIAFIAIAVVWAVFFGFILKGRFNKARKLAPKKP